MLCADGAAAGSPAGLSQAVFAYNHSPAYVADVFAWAARYTAPLAAGTGTAGAGGTAAQAISFAMAQLGKPYVWGATGPDAYDCSGLVYAAYASQRRSWSGLCAVLSPGGDHCCPSARSTFSAASTRSHPLLCTLSGRFTVSRSSLNRLSAFLSSPRASCMTASFILPP
jgi:hypothetical protein